MRQQLERTIVLHRKESMALNQASGNSILHNIMNLKLLSCQKIYNKLLLSVEA